MIKTPLSTVIGGVGMYTKNSLIIGGKTEPPFDPATLFENGEIGTLLDATDLSTLFQDNTGLIASTVSQPIGLIFDKNQNVLDANLWEVNRVDSNWLDNNDGTYTSNGTGFLGIVNQINLNIGSFYEWCFEIIEFKQGLLRPQNSTGIGYTYENHIGVHIKKFLCSSAVTALYYANNFVGTIRPMHLKKIDAYNASQVDSSKRPLLQNDIKFDGIDDALNITFPSALTNCTIFSVKHGQQAQILEAQSVAQNHVINQDFKYYGIVNRALTSAERAGLTRFLNKLGAQ